MDRPFFLSRLAAPSLAVCLAGIVAGLTVVAIYGGSSAFAVTALLSAALLYHNHRLNRALAQARGIGSAPLSIAHQDLDQIASLSHRLAPAHPVSGLPVREALLARMTAGGSGLLGAIAFADLDRLTAFDPALGERVFATFTARLRNMLPPDRLVAQVDRGHIGLWFDAETELQASAELQAIVYALGEAIDDDGTHVMPRINHRLARFDLTDGLDAGAFLARTLAGFALPGSGTAGIEQPAADHAGRERERYALEQDLRQAIARRELRLEYQPLIDAAHGQVCGAEALLRWHHPVRGAISPGLFIPIMEAAGLANEIGTWVLNAAAREAHDWVAKGLGRLRVAVNVSGLQLERDDLPVLVQRTLQRHALGPSAFEIELTESVATSDAAHCRRIFEQLRAMGVKLAVDDFGTGYSGFSSLRRLAFDKIKIDREFVTDVDTRRDSQAICQSIVALGRGLGINVLAEGVERRAEYEWLRRHGCHHFQGYYFAKPMPGEAFVAFVRNRTRLEELLRLSTSVDQIEARLRA